MKNLLELVIAFGSVGLIAGCGGGGAVLAVPPSYGNLDAAAAILEATYTPLAPTATTLANVPTGPGAPTATYDGFIRGDVDPGGLNAGAAPLELIGELTLTADFDAGTVSGTAGNFVDENDVNYTGSISGSTGIVRNIGFDQAEIVPNLTGDIGGFATTVGLDGVFAGANAEGAAGIFLGNVGAEAFDGTFVAEQ